MEQKDMEQKDADSRPGACSVDVHATAFAADPYPTYTYLRDRCPVMHSDLYGGFWLLTRYGDVKEAALDWQTYTSSVPGVTALPIITHRSEPQLPLELDPPVHAKYRRLVNPVFSKARIGALRPEVEAVAEELLERLVTAGGGDLVSAYCVPLATQTLGIFTGLPSEDGARWASWISRMFGVHDPEDARRATREFGAYIDDLISESRASPKDDFFGLLMSAEIGGEALSDAEIHAFGTLVFGAGFETTADALSVMLYHLATHPSDFERLRAEPNLIPSSAEEFLRFSSPVQIFCRNAKRELELYKQTVPQGDVIALSFGSANRDPETFDRPDEVDLSRHPNPHLAFGAGVHLCLGAPVARLELAVTLEQCLKHISSLTLKAPAVWKKRGDRRGLAELEVRVTPKRGAETGAT